MALRINTQGVGISKKMLYQPDTGLALNFPLPVSPVKQSTSNMTGGDFTFEGWFYITAFVNPPLDGNNITYSGSDTRQFMHLGYGPGGYTFFMESVLIGVAWHVRVFNYTDGAFYTCPQSITAKRWYHVRFDYRLSDLRLRIHLDNDLCYTSNMGGGFGVTDDFAIGHIDSNRSQYNFYGQMDGLRWWKSVRTDAQNLATWRKRNKGLAEINTASCFAAYDFEDAPTTATMFYEDQSGNGLKMADYGNTRGGTQRGSSVPYDTYTETSNKKLQLR